MQTSQRREVTLDEDPGRVFTAVRGVVEREGWTVVDLDEEVGSVVFRSPRTPTSWARSYLAVVAPGTGVSVLTVSCSFDTRKTFNLADGWRNRRALDRLLASLGDALAGH